MHIQILPYSRFPEHTRRRLRRATLRGGHMRAFARVVPSSETYVALSDPLCEVMGWAIVTPLLGRMNVGVFVNRRYRGKSVGRRLMEEVLKRHQSITVFEWDACSRTFFRALAAAYPGRVQRMDWWKHEQAYLKELYTYER